MLVAVFCSLVEFRHLALHAEFSVLFVLWLVFRFVTAPETRTTSACCGTRDCAHFSTRFAPNFSEKIRGRKSFGPRSHEIASKSALTDDVRPCHDPNKSLKSLSSFVMLRHAGLRGFFGAMRTNGKSLKMAATLGHNIKCVERER